MNIHQILLKYWGYPSFRPMQEEIISSVLAGKDTLGLLPTGGGKSICFQVPTLSIEGLCIIVTPLIALMNDQVENLKKRGINAAAIHSGMHTSEIDVVINNCIYDQIKFLYLSPERLNTDMIMENIERMNVALLTVDEAHCISQWGYDFRPPYLHIADIRSKIPNVPILALTATATPKVVSDIQEKLNFKNQNAFQLSFDRKNLTYVALKEENKLQRLLKIVNNLKGSGIVYLRSRRRTVEIAEFLNRNNANADFYHAGLDPAIRNRKQSAWKTGKLRIMVSTNAFGMGIDKPDVRFVVHLDIPDSVEAYFQEAGRAGRDEKRAYAVMLYEEADVINIKSYSENAFPPIKEIKMIYNALGNYYQLAIGSGKDIGFEFDIADFSKSYNLNRHTVNQALKFLEKEGYISLIDVLNANSKIHLTVNKEDLYRFQVENKKYDTVLKIILRSYSGLFTDFVKINEHEIAKRADLKTEQIISLLSKFEKLEILKYIRKRNKPQIIFITERLDSKNILISDEHYKFRKSDHEDRVNSVLNYIQNNNNCRSQQLLEYFGETNTKRCGTCDVCIERNKMELSEIEFDNILNQIKPVLKEKPLTIAQIAEVVKGASEEKIIKVIQYLLDNDKIVYDQHQKLSWQP